MKRPMGIEVVEPADSSEDSQLDAHPRLVIPPSPVHPLSSLVTIVLDLLWTGTELGATLSIVAAPGIIPLICTCAAACFFSVTLIQHYVDHDAWGPAIAKAIAMGIMAGVPYPVVGTSAGSVLLGWAGVHKIESHVRQLLTSRSAKAA